MKIAFATIFDPNDIRRGSGTFYFMSREIERQGATVHYIGPLPVSIGWQTRVLAGLHRRRGRRYKQYVDPWVARQRGRQVTKQLDQLDYDCLLTNDYGIAGYTQTEKPIIVYTDAMIPYEYPGSITSESRIANLSPVGVKLFQNTLKRGLGNAQLCIFPADWIMKEALQYISNSSKMHLIPFGANIIDPGPETAQFRTLQIIGGRLKFDLLFVGKDWKRKGGDIAVATTEQLRLLEIDARLHTVGGSLPDKLQSAFVVDHGYLDKSVAKQNKALDKLYRECDAFILPSTSEGAVMAVVEAAAYGLPVLAYRVPGVCDRVIDGHTGRLFNIDSCELAFSRTIAEWLNAPHIYQQMVVGARNHFETSHNWENAVEQLLALVKHMMV